MVDKLCCKFMKKVRNRHVLKRNLAFINLRELFMLLPLNSYNLFNPNRSLEKNFLLFLMTAIRKSVLYMFDT